MPHPEPASPLHETMLEMLHEARRRGMAHSEHSLPVCELLLEIHAPAGVVAGEPCKACREPWPCKTVLDILGGLEPAAGPPAPAASSEDTLTPGGVVYTYFAAPADELAASTIRQSGTSDAAELPLSGSPAVEDAGFDPVLQCGTLEAILTGRAYEEIEASPGWGRLVAEHDGGERYVVALTDELTSALALSTADGRRTAARQWAQTEAFFGEADPEVLASRLDELSELARAARRSGDRLYCRVCV
ncbi:hypothetical protein [Sinomonas sp. RB5]